MYYTKKCPNMNHGRTPSMVNFCPTCGENFKNIKPPKCDNEKHMARRKNRDQYCIDCGLHLVQS